MFKYNILCSALIAVTVAPCWGAARSAEEHDSKISVFSIDTSDSIKDIFDSSEIQSEQEDSDFSKTSKRKSKKAKRSANHMLLTAAKNGDEDTVISALEKGADVDATDIKGRTSLIVATTQCNRNVITILLERSADVNAKSKAGMTPLMFLAQRGRWGESHCAIATQLIEANADVDATDNEGRSALLLAVQTENLKTESKVSPFLIKAGADVDAAFTQAVDSDDEWAAGFLRACGGKILNPTEAQKAKMASWGISQKQRCCAVS